MNFKTLTYGPDNPVAQQNEPITPVDTEVILSS